MCIQVHGVPHDVLPCGRPCACAAVMLRQHAAGGPAGRAADGRGVVVVGALRVSCTPATRVTAAASHACAHTPHLRALHGSGPSAAWPLPPERPPHARSGVQGCGDVVVRRGGRRCNVIRWDQTFNAAGLASVNC